MSDYTQEFRDYDDILSFPKGWQDVSWKNDTCPSFERKYGDMFYRIFCEYKDPDKRESLGSKRFVVYYIEDEDNFVYVDVFDTLEEAIAVIENEAETS